MAKICIADITLREHSEALSFKEKTETAKLLDRLNVDVIEAPLYSGDKTENLFLHTIAPIIKNSIISCPVSPDKQAVADAAKAISSAKKPRLNINVPVSTVQMEYICHKKPDKMLELIADVLEYATGICDDVEVSFLDATRAEKEFLYKMLHKVMQSGAKTVTICDTAGEMLPDEFEKYIKDIYENVPELENIVLSVECSDELSMAVASAMSCIAAGAGQIKAAMHSHKCPELSALAHVIRAKTEALKIKTNLNMSFIDSAVKNLSFITKPEQVKADREKRATEKYDDEQEDLLLTAKDDIKTVKKVIKKMGYDLSAEDIENVYNEFLKTAARKNVGIKELDAIVASTAMQVAPTYKIKSYVINSGNIMSPTANIELLKNGEEAQGICTGDGPVDACFKAIEQITGHHYELDDFQIQAITRGREALGESIVKLRYEGKLYSGKGTSTDIVGASIKAYINALNKICFEEEI